MSAWKMNLVQPSWHGMSVPLVGSYRQWYPKRIAGIGCLIWIGCVWLFELMLFWKRFWDVVKIQYHLIFWFIDLKGLISSYSIHTLHHRLCELIVHHSSKCRTSSLSDLASYLITFHQKHRDWKRRVALAQQDSHHSAYFIMAFRIKVEGVAVCKIIERLNHLDIFHAASVYLCCNLTLGYLTMGYLTYWLP